MKKVFSFAVVACLSMSFAFSVMSCGGGAKSGDGADSTGVEGTEAEAAPAEEKGGVLGIWIDQKGYDADATISQYVFKSDGTYSKYDAAGENITGEKGKYVYTEAEKKLELTPEGGSPVTLNCSLNGTSQIVLKADGGEELRYSTKEQMAINSPEVCGTWKSQKGEIVLKEDLTCSIKLDDYTADGTYNIVTSGTADKIVVTANGATKVIKISINDADSDNFRIEDGSTVVYPFKKQ